MGTRALYINELKDLEFGTLTKFGKPLSQFFGFLSVRQNSYMKLDRFNLGCMFFPSPIPPSVLFLYLEQWSISLVLINLVRTNLRAVLRLNTLAADILFQKWQA